MVKLVGVGKPNGLDAKCESQCCLPAGRANYGRVTPRLPRFVVQLIAPVDLGHPARVVSTLQVLQRNAGLNRKGISRPKMKRLNRQEEQLGRGEGGAARASSPASRRCPTRRCYQEIAIPPQVTYLRFHGCG
jgi:hypothetical protein